MKHWLWHKTKSMFKRKVYFDNNATTYVSRPVRKAMNRVLRNVWGNPSSGYQLGKMSNNYIEKSRKTIADSIHAHPHEIYFSSCATESNNAILKTLSQHFYPRKKKIISTPIEHPSVINTLEFLKTQGIEVHYCQVDSFGFVSIESLKKLIDDDTFLICCMYANNEIGTIQNIKAISNIAKEYNILLMSDCVQAFGKIAIDVKDMGVDYATFSAHKLYGPKGVGVLYSRISSPLFPFIHGGHQEEETRAGTESIHNIVGFAQASKEVSALVSKSVKVNALREFFIQQVVAIKPDIVVYSPIEKGLSNTLSIRFTGIKSKELMMMLDYYGISVSSGSACSSQQNQPSHVLKAIGLTDEAAEETIRISFGKDTSLKDIKYVIKILKKYLKNQD